MLRQVSTQQRTGPGHRASLLAQPPSLNRRQGLTAPIERHNAALAGCATTGTTLQPKSLITTSGLGVIFIQ
jgi:hypothetical protein